jgi:cytochrome b561
LLLFAGLLASAMLVDYLFHVMKWAWVGKYCGFLGTLAILLSFLYSLRKRNLVRTGSPKALLKGHEVLGWVGALLILVHGGIHFYALIPWLALLAMLIVVASGLTGRFLLEGARTRLKAQEQALQEAGRAADEIEKELLGSSLLVDTMKQWRRVHMPLTMVFAALSLLHIAATLLFWKW